MSSLPSIIGNYEILSKLGEGGLGEVYKAVHVTKGNIVALKLIHSKFQKSSKILGLFHKETMIHARVNHRHCVQFIEANLNPPHAHIVTSFIDGHTLGKLISKVGALPPMIACSIILDMLQGIEHLHCLDIIHSDITPSNVLVQNNGLVLVADFGLSCLSEVENYEGMNVGTLGYQSPERLLYKPITVESDVYGAGILLYELLTGRRLFNTHNPDPRSMIAEMQKIRFQYIQTPIPQLTKALQNILSKALHYKYKSRYSSPRDFMYALYECIQMKSIRYTRRGILQWLNQKQLTDVPPEPPSQDIS